MNFIQFIKLTVEAEAKLEEIRMLLASFESFEPFTVYKRLDQPRTGGLKEENILEFLEDNHIKVSKEELQYIFRVFDTDSDGLVTYQDFKNVILPKQNEQIKDQVLGHKSYEMPIGMLLPGEVENQLSQFFVQIQQNFNQYMNITEQIDLNQLDIYANNNQITVESLNHWLETLNMHISEELLQNFVIIIDGSQQNLQNILDSIYSEPYIPQNEDLYQDQQQVEEEVEREVINQQDELQDSLNPQIASQQEPDYPEEQEYDYQQKASPQLITQSYLPYRRMNEIERYIEEEKSKIYCLIRQIEYRLFYRTIDSPILDFYDRQIQRELFSLKTSINRSFCNIPSFDDNNSLRQKIRLDQEIMREEINQKILLTQIQNSSIANKYAVPSTKIQPLHKSKYEQILSKFESPQKKSKIVERKEYSGEKNQVYQKETAKFGQRKINQSENKKWV